MAYKIIVDPRAEKEIDKIDKQIRARIVQFIYKRLAVLDNPRSIGEAMKGERFGELWKYRVGDYRLICKIEDDCLVVLVLRVSHRKEV